MLISISMCIIITGHPLIQLSLYKFLSWLLQYSGWDKNVRSTSIRNRGHGDQKGRSWQQIRKHYFPVALPCSFVSQFLCQYCFWFTFYPLASDIDKTHGLVPATIPVYLIFKNFILPVKYFSFHSQIKFCTIILPVSMYAVKNLFSGISGILF